MPPRVRAWVVAALPERDEPVEADRIAAALDLARGEGISILGELERRLVFLARNPAA